MTIKFKFLLDYAQLILKDLIEPFSSSSTKSKKKNRLFLPQKKNNDHLNNGLEVIVENLKRGVSLKITSLFCRK